MLRRLWLLLSLAWMLLVLSIGPWQTINGLPISQDGAIRIFGVAVFPFVAGWLLSKSARFVIGR